MQVFEKKRKIFAIILSICMFGSLMLMVCLTAFVKNNSIDALASLEGTLEVELDKTYAYNAEFTVPAATITVGDAKLDADGVVVYPSGKESAEDNCVLTETGLYSVRYTAVDGDKTYSQSRNFFVKKPAFEVTAAGGSAVFGEYPGVPAAGEGILVSIPQGGVLKYEEVIDLTNAVCDLSSTSNTPILSMSFVPNKYDPDDAAITEDFKTLRIKFTDVEDESKYFVVSATSEPEKGNGGYYRAAGNGSAPSGYDDFAKAVRFEGGPAGQYGAYVATSFDANFDKVPVEIGSAFNLYYDNVTKMVAAQNSNVDVPRMIIDLDSSEHFNTTLGNGNPWTGFSGKVKMSIEMGGYTDPEIPARILLKSVGGVTLTSETKMEYEDETAPEFVRTDVAFGFTGKDFNVYDLVTVKDRYYGSEYTVQPQAEVTYGGEKITLTDGVFKPTKSGIYEVTFTAEDFFSNQSKFTCSFSVFNEDGSDATLSDIELKDKYLKGETLEIPHAKITVGGKEYDAQFILYCPDGSAFVRESIVLDQMGIYTLEYRAQVGEKLVSIERDFKVYSSQASVSDNSATQVGYHETIERTGVRATLKEETEFRYNKIIDLNGADITKPIVEMYVLPSVTGENDFNYLEYIFMDIYDPTNYITISCNVIDGTTPYYKANSRTQTPTGYEAWNNVIHRGDEYGAFVATSFNGTFDGKENLKQFGGTRIFYDAANKALYAQNMEPNPPVFIIDLDDPKYFADLWKGFTTNEVYLTVRASNFSKESGEIFLVSAGGEDVSAEESFFDTGAPKISINYGDYTKDTVPGGAVGLPYTVFSASATDSYSLYTQVTTRVFRNYGSADQINVSVSDGVFVPKVAGIYTIEYTAVDHCGNKSVVVQNVEIEEQADAISTEINEDGDLLGSTGVKVRLAKVSASGGYGEKKLQVKVVWDGGEIIPDGDSFVPQAPGEYKVVYVFTDYCGQVKQYEYTVTITTAEKPVFTNSVQLPKYMLEGSYYTLPEMTAYDFALDADAEIKITATDEDGTDRVIENRRYKPNVANSGDEVTITYTAISSNGNESISFKVPVYIVKEDRYIDLTKYFVGDGFNQSLTETSISLTATKDGAYSEFINPVLVSGFSLRFSLKGGNVWSISLTDSLNSAISLTVEIKMVGGTCMVSCGSMKTAIDAAFDDQSVFELSIDNELQTLKLNTAEFDISGLKLMETMQNKTAYMRISTSGFAGETPVMNLDQLNNQPFNSKIRLDQVRPQIVYLGDYGGSYSINSEYVIKSVFMLDVLNPDIQGKVTVTDPDGNIVKDINGVELNGISAMQNYTIRLEKYGSYIVYYQADVSDNWDEEFMFLLQVDDETAPELHISGETELSGKVNKKVKLPTVTATDNLTKEVKVYKYLVTPAGIEKPLAADEFVPEAAGVYKVRYLAFDEAGNFSTITVTVKVS